MTSSQENNTNETITVQTAPTATSSGIQLDGRIKLGILGTAVAALVVGMFVVFFFWHHWIATFGMKSWSSHAGATPIECMIKDTNNDGYVSCSAMLQGEVVPLECGASVFNIGCRVNYGSAAAPPVRPLPNGGRS